MMALFYNQDKNAVLKWLLILTSSLLGIKKQLEKLA